MNVETKKTRYTHIYVKDTHKNNEEAEAQSFKV